MTIVPNKNPQSEHNFPQDKKFFKYILMSKEMVSFFLAINLFNPSFGSGAKEYLGL